MPWLFFWVHFPFAIVFILGISVYEFPIELNMFLIYGIYLDLDYWSILILYFFWLLNWRHLQWWFQMICIGLSLSLYFPSVDFLIFPSVCLLSLYHAFLHLLLLELWLSMSPSIIHFGNLVVLAQWPNFFRWSLAWKYLISPFISKDSFAGYINLS